MTKGKGKTVLTICTGTNRRGMRRGRHMKKRTGKEGRLKNRGMGKKKNWEDEVDKELMIMKVRGKKRRWGR